MKSETPSSKQTASGTWEFILDKDKPEANEQWHGS